MTSMQRETNSSVLKADARGRVLTAPERREQLLDEFERNGLSSAKFAALTGLKYPTFAAWVQRRRHHRGAKGQNQRSRRCGLHRALPKGTRRNAELLLSGGGMTRRFLSSAEFFGGTRFVERQSVTAGAPRAD